MTGLLMAIPTKILLVDDDEDDRFITEDLLHDAPGEFILNWVSNYVDGLEQLRLKSFDVCLVDYMIGSEVGLNFVAKAKSMDVRCPMILLTGVGHHDIDKAATDAGAADFLDKGNLTPIVLERAIRYARAHSQALQELSDQSSVLETTLESIQSGIATFDANGNLMNANKLFRNLLAEAKFPTAWNVDQSSSSDSALETVAVELLSTLATLETKAACELELEDGRIYDLRVDPVLGGGDVMLMFDVTGQKTLQRRMMEAKLAAEAANEMKSAFLAKMSHELRTPLNGVFGMAQLIRLGPLDDQQCRNLNRLLESAISLNALIEDLLDISVIEQGRFNLNEEELDIHKLISDANDIASAAALNGEMNIVSRVEIPQQKRFLGDGRRIVQIIVNFLNNAQKFAPKTQVEVGARELTSSHIRFWVRDNGPGIARKLQNDIFNRFVQVEENISRRHGGVGLGLSIAKELVEQMGGRIGVNSYPGEGAEFWFDLPLEVVTHSLNERNIA